MTSALITRLPPWASRTTLRSELGVGGDAIVTVGAVTYPTPGFVTMTSVISPFESARATPSAVVPTPTGALNVTGIDVGGSIVTVGGVTPYPAPGFVTLIDVITPFTSASAKPRAVIAPGPAGGGSNVTGIVVLFGV